MKRRTPKPRARKPARRPVKITPESPLTQYDPQAAAIDVGAESHWVAVSPEGRAESVREFGVFTADLYAIADWLKACGVKRVALESTGVYWIPLFEVLEERGMEVRLVVLNAYKDRLYSLTLLEFGRRLCKMAKPFIICRNCCLYGTF